MIVQLRYHIILVKIKDLIKWTDTFNGGYTHIRTTFDLTYPRKY